MPAPQPTALELSCEPVGAFEALALDGASRYTAAIDPWAAAPRGFEPREPSALGLLLVGVATIAVYRGLVKAMGGEKPARRADEGLIKPRRRAA